MGVPPPIWDWMGVPPVCMGLDGTWRGNAASGTSLAVSRRRIFLFVIVLGFTEYLCGWMVLCIRVFPGNNSIAKVSSGKMLDKNKGQLSRESVLLPDVSLKDIIQCKVFPKQKST